MIKFRGKTKENKWVEGYYLHIDDDAFGILSNKHVIWPKKSSQYIEVFPDSIGMFTGNLDKKRTKEFPKGQEIYGSIEIDGKITHGGDIVNYSKSRDFEGHKAFVCFWKGGFRLFKSMKDEFPLAMEIKTVVNRLRLEVIGSQFDTELKGQ